MSPSSIVYVYALIDRPRRPVLSRVPVTLPGASSLELVEIGARLWAVTSHVPRRVYHSEPLAARIKDLTWVADAGLAHDGKGVGTDAALVRRRGKDGRSAGDRVDEGDLADVVQEGGVLEIEQIPLGQAELAAHRDGGRRDPLGVSRRGVAGDIGEPSQGADALQIGGPDADVSAEGEEREDQG